MRVVKKERRREEEPDAHFCDVGINLPDQRHAVKNLFLYFFRRSDTAENVFSVFKRGIEVPALSSRTRNGRRSPADYA